MKNRTISILLLVSFCLNLFLGYLYILGEGDKKEERLEMDIKCATFLPDLKKKDEAGTDMSAEGFYSQQTEVFFSPSKNTCIAVRKYEGIPFKGDDQTGLWTIVNLFTNETLNQTSWVSKKDAKTNPNKDLILDEINKLKL